MRRLLALAAALIALTACGNESADPPPFTDSASPSGTPSESESAEAAPTLPPEVKGTSPDAAVATVKLFIDEVNRATGSGDTRLLKMLYVRDCENCVALVSGLEMIYDDGGKVTGGTWSESKVGRPVGGTQGQMGVAVLVTGSKQVLQRSAQSPPKTYEGGAKSQLAFTMIKRSGRWVVTTLTREEL